jgi:putative MATE family efflux protein
MSDEPKSNERCDVEPGVETPLAPEAVIGKPAGLPNHLPLWRIVLVLAWWPLLEQLMGALVGFVDTALAGRLDPAATEAIGSSGYVLWLMGMMQGAVGVGATAIIARAVGAGRYREANHAVGQAMMLALIWGAINTVLFWFAAPLVALVTSLEGHAADLCVMYLQWLALVAPCRAVLFIGSACLRGAGDTRSPFFVMLAVNIINVIVSVSLVADFSPIGGFGLRGVAMGTMVAWIVGMVLMAIMLLKGRGGVKLMLPEMRFDRVMTGRLVRIGAPALLESAVHWAGNLLVVVIVGRLAILGLAERPMGSQIIGIRIEAFSFLLGFAFNIAASTMVGQYLGVNDIASAKRAAWISWAYGSVIMVGFGLIFMLLPGPLVRIFTDQEPFLSAVPPILFHAGWAQIGFASYLVLSGALRGAGDTRMTMYITFGCTFLIRLPLAYLIGVQWGYGLTGVWIALAIELIVRGGVFMARFLHGGWTRIKV